MKSIMTHQICNHPVLSVGQSVPEYRTKILQFSSHAIVSDWGFHSDGIPQENNACDIQVFSIKKQWKEIIVTCSDPNLHMIISKRSVLGKMILKDRIDASPPESFAGKLLAILFHRFRFFKGQKNKGLKIILIGVSFKQVQILESVILELAHLNNLEPAFIDWIENANEFCTHKR